MQVITGRDFKISEFKAGGYETGNKRPFSKRPGCLEGSARNHNERPSIAIDRSSIPPATGFFRFRVCGAVCDQFRDFVIIAIDIY